MHKNQNNCDKCGFFMKKISENVRKCSKCGLIETRPNTRFTMTDKKIAFDYAENHTNRQAGQLFGVSEATISSWKTEVRRAKQKKKTIKEALKEGKCVAVKGAEVKVIEAPEVETDLKNSQYSRIGDLVVALILLAIIYFVIFGS